MISRTGSEPWILALDLGGTDIKRGAGDENGDPLTDTTRTAKLPSLVLEGPESTLGQFRRAYDEFTDRFDGPPAAIGLATAGPATLDGVIERSTNYGPLWNNCPIRQLTEEYFGVPTAYENDANAAVLAEFRSLCSQKPEFNTGPGILFTVGTGLGGGVINSSGELERGAYGLGAELGHLPMREKISSVNLEQAGIRCGCGQCGCAEQYTTLSYIEREVQARQHLEPTHALYRIQDPREAAKRVLSMAVDGDLFARSIILDQARNLGLFIGEQIVDKDPRWTLIGGGITEASPEMRELYLHTVLDRVAYRVGDDRLKRVYVDYAALGDNAGWVGAAISAARMLERSSNS